MQLSNLLRAFRDLQSHKNATSTLCGQGFQNWRLLQSKPICACFCKVKNPSILCTAFTVLRAINSLLTVFSVAGKLEFLCTRLELGYAHGENYLFVFPMIVSKISRPNLNLIWVFCLWFLSLLMIRLAFCIRFGYLTWMLLFFHLGSCCFL